MAKKQVSAKGKPAKVWPVLRRMECAGCDTFTVCADKGGAWLCVACTPQKEPLKR